MPTFFLSSSAALLAASSPKSELSGKESTELVGLLVRLVTGNVGAGVALVELAEASAGWAFNRLTTLVLKRVSGEGLKVCFLDETEPVRFASMVGWIGG